ncbi:MAG: molybdopterin-dependent oxidoreductase, partial [Armatimonadetes bacterium]|nr:molybdopterin-dependent oxidoreductase [Armatimonadota bacterium]
SSAMASGAQSSDQTLFADLKKGAAGGGGQGGGRGNVNQGSMEKGLAEADHKLQATYTIAYIAHVPLEPRAAVAQWENGKLTVWTGTQRPFGVRQELMQAFGLPAEQVRVIVPDTGSGYGGKHTGEAAVEAACLARAAGRPVKVLWSRQEEFTWAYFRPAGVMDIISGARRDGTLTAWEQHTYNAGPAGLSMPYEVPHSKTESHNVRGPLRQGSYRGLAGPANFFARESHLDELARAVGQDPLAFRLHNLRNERLRAVFLAAAERFGWGRRAPGTGIGVAGGIEKGGYVATCVEAGLERGRIKVYRAVTAFECGALHNPDAVRNQIEGMHSMGLGGALFEAIHFADGKILNPSLSRYRVPRFSDQTPLEVVLLDRRDLPSAGAGETPLMALAPAIANALHDATGQRLRALPLTLPASP